jgi:hypothetical protein
VIDQLDRQAARITTNRVVAGVHFPVDSMAGRMLGVALGEYFVARCTAAQTFKGRKFVAAEIDSAPTTDFNPFNAAQDLDSGTFYSQSAAANIAQSNLMPYVWGTAKREWVGRFGVLPPPP